MAIALSPLTLGTLVRGVAITPIVLAASGGTGPYTYTIASGQLPAGLALNTATISGTPVEPGPYSFVVHIVDDVAATKDVVFTGYVEEAPSITPKALGSLTRGSAMTPVDFNPVGGTGPFAFSITEGRLPAGLSLNPSTGVVSGTPEVAGSYYLKLAIEDSAGYVGIITLTGSVADITSPFMEGYEQDGNTSSQTLLVPMGLSKGGFPTVKNAGDSVSIHNSQVNDLKTDKVIS